MLQAASDQQPPPARIALPEYLNKEWSRIVGFWHSLAPC